MERKLRSDIEQLFRQHHPSMVAYARRRLPEGHIVRSHHSASLNADDCIQLAYLKVYRWVDTNHQLPRNFHAFTRQAIRMVAAGEYRSANRRQEKFHAKFGDTPVDPDTLMSLDGEEGSS